MKGGDPKVIPLFEPQNSPFVPTTQKEILNRDVVRPLFSKQDLTQYGQNAQNAPKQQSQFGKPLVDLQVYQPPPTKRPPPKQDAINPALYMPIPAQTPFYPPQFNPSWPYYYTPQIVSPIVKQYSINNGPFVNYSALSVVKEDALPKQFVNTSNTLGERLNIHNFVRSVFIKYNDGEDIDLDGKGNNSLLSYLKFMELNPYNTTQHPENPYKGLPDDMLIYRSCYPIKYDERTNTTQCAPNSIGMNIRIYKLTNAEYSIKKLQQTNFHEYDVWREMAYYEYIREEILKRKVCPNFILMYAYYISEKCNVDFNKIKQLKGTLHRPQIKRAIQPPIYQNIQQNTQQNTQSNIQSTAQQMQKLINDSKQQFIKEQQFNDMLGQYSGKGIVALTEGPTYNIFGWSSKSYKINGNIQKMVNTGYHKKEVWMSVLFQLMVGMYVLQLHKIAFNKFTLEDNVYIKDISQHENMTTYWKYKVNGFDFYVPNYGYLVQIDSNFKDLDPSCHTLIKAKQTTQFKIYSNMFKDNAYDENSINKVCFESFKIAINPNTFTNAFTNYGGTKPPEEILALLQEIYRDATSPNAITDIGHYIINHMGKLLNNRIGTYLTETETKNIRKDDNTQFTIGQIIVHEVQHQTYKFVIVLEEVNNQVTVLTRKDPKDENLSKETIERSLLFNYSKYDPIVQNYKPMESNLTEDDLLETYVISK